MARSDLDSREWPTEPIGVTTAIEHNLILVTRNLRDYRSIPALQLYGLI
jgi:hypothetical protein